MPSKSSQLKVAVVGMEPPEAGGAHNAEYLMLGQIEKSLDFHETITVGAQRSPSHESGIFGRVAGFIRSLRAIWGSNPLSWATSRRFSWISSTSFEKDLLKKSVDFSISRSELS
jgi:hypothetical protein